MKTKLHLRACTVTSALGRGMAAHQQALLQQRSGLRPCDLEDVDLNTWIGRVDGLENRPIEDRLSDYDCRNNRLAQLGLEQDGFMQAVAASRSQHGGQRIGVFIGTSTSGIQQAEQAYAKTDATGRLPDSFNYPCTHNVFSSADYLQRVLQLQGPAQVISTACSSSAKVFATAYRFMQAGLCDAAIVGGVDSLCQTTLYGFDSLQLLSSHPCRPADQARDGISIGEAAGFALLEWATDTNDDDICLLGYGESSDAYHISSPHPQGKGALLAMQGALESAQLEAEQIDYLNLHGTATPANDAAEDQAVYALFNDTVPCSSTKGFTGHTLGAAGMLEVALACIAIENDLLPVSLNTTQRDPDIQSAIVMPAQNITQGQSINRVMSNAFGFGGSNISLIIGRSS